MMSKTFWLSAIITVALIGLQIYGYPTLELIAVFLLLDVIIMRFSGSRTIKNFGKRAEEHSSKINSVQSIVSGFEKSIDELTSFMNETKNVHAAEQTTMGVIQGALDRHKDDLRMEFKDGMDKIAGKIIEIENDYHDFKRGFASAIGAMDDRLKMIEVPNGNHSIAPAEIAEKFEEEYAEINGDGQN